MLPPAASRSRPARVPGATRSRAAASRSGAAGRIIASIGPATMARPPAAPDRSAPASGTRSAAARGRAARGPGQRVERRPEPRRERDVDREPGGRVELRLRAGVAERADELEQRADLGFGRGVAPAARPASPPRSAASGSPAACGSSAQIASVTNGITGWSRRRYVSSASTSVHQVASRVGGRQRLVGQADLGQLQRPVAVLAPDRLVQDAGELAERVLGERPVDGGRPSAADAAAGSSARPGRAGPGRGAARGASGGDRRGPRARARSGPRSRACWRSCARSPASRRRAAGRCPAPRR